MTKNTAFSSPPQASAMSFLVDENVCMRTLAPMAKRDITLTHVNDIALNAHPDHEIFDYAAKHAMYIVTTDSDFCRPGNLDYSQALGTVILPYSSGKGPHREQLLDDAFAHFFAKASTHLQNVKGAIIRYKRNATVAILEPHPTRPRELVCVAAEPYSYGA